MTAAALLDSLETLADAPGGIDHLRELVLHLAVRGRLVTQDPANEPASVLVDRIGASGAVEPCRVLKPIESAGLPEIPATWQWVRLREIVNLNVGKTPSTKNSQYWADEGGIPWVSIGDMEHYGFVTSTAKHISPKAQEEVFRTDPVPHDTLLMSFKLTIGKVARLDCDAFHNEAIVSVLPGEGEMKEYLFRLLPVFAALGKTKAAIKGNTLNKTSLANIPVAVPPLEEQHRIVARVDELMALLDRLEAAKEARDATRAQLRDAALAALQDANGAEEVKTAWSRIADHMHDLFTDPADIPPLRQSILRLATRGRLVAQDPLDEPPQIDLKAAKKLKREGLWSPSWVVDAPTQWARCPMACLGTWGSGGTPKKGNHDYYDGDIPWLKIADLNDGLVQHAETHITKRGLEDSSARMIPTGAVLLAMYGSIGKSGIAGIECCSNQAIAHCVPDDRAISASYLFRLIVSLREELLAQGKGGAQQNISQTVIKHLEVAVPPLQEQRRIVARVDELMALLDRLEASLSDLRATREAFATSAVRALPEHGVEAPAEGAITVG